MLGAAIYYIYYLKLLARRIYDFSRLGEILVLPDYTLNIAINFDYSLKIRFTKEKYIELSNLQLFSLP